MEKDKCVSCIQKQTTVQPEIPASTVARVTEKAVKNGVHAAFTTTENSVKVRFNFIVHMFQIYLSSLLRYTIFQDRYEF